MRKVRVRIAVAVDREGDWCAYGYSTQSGDAFADLVTDDLLEGEARYFVEAELEVPEVKTIQGNAVEKGGSGG